MASQTVLWLPRCIYTNLWNAFLRLLLGRNWWDKRFRYSTLFFKIGMRLHYFRDAGRDFVQSKLPDGIVPIQSHCLRVIDEIYVHKVYTKLRKIMPDDVVIDCGAHVGVFTLKAAAKAKAGVVVAVEPDRLNYKLLAYNIRNNGIKNVLTVNSALSNFNGTSKLYIAEEMISHTIAPGRTTARLRGDSVEVDVKTLDQLVDELKLTDVSFIKVDCEGVEENLLKGAEKTLQSNDVFLSIAAEHREGETQEVCKYLSEKGFSVFFSPRHVYAFKDKTKMKNDTVSFVSPFS